MKFITQQNLFLSILENLVRSNIYLFILIRNLIPKFFSKFIYESDFKILKLLNKTKHYNGNQIIDIGANDGISIKSIRNFSKKRIISFEPGKKNFLKIKKEKFKNVKIYNIGLSNKKKKNIILYQPFFKNFHISPFDSIKKKDVINHLNNTIFDNYNLKKIVIKKEKVIIDKLDNFKTKPFFIKIDIQGHENECIQGALSTIKKYHPVIMVEYDKVICNRIYLTLKKLKYKKYFYSLKYNKILNYRNEKIHNIFFIRNNISNI
jgi:FkbM family methyltransferase